jgi:hypothetical protein
LQRCRKITNNYLKEGRIKQYYKKLSKRNLKNKKIKISISSLLRRRVYAHWTPSV